MGAWARRMRASMRARRCACNGTYMHAKTRLVLHRSQQPDVTSPDLLLILRRSGCKGCLTRKHQCRHSPHRASQRLDEPRRQSNRSEKSIKVHLKVSNTHHRALHCAATVEPSKQIKLDQQPILPSLLPQLREATRSPTTLLPLGQQLRAVHESSAALHVAVCLLPCLHVFSAPRKRAAKELSVSIKQSRCTSLHQSAVVESVLYVRVVAMAMAEAVGMAPWLLFWRRGAHVR
eukprot:6184297-Pleurochrysis_carterae.AAC.1